MTKNDLIEAGARMLSDVMHRAGENIREHIRDDVVADLREKVMALPTENGYTEGPRFIDRAAVLALFDGSK